MKQGTIPWAVVRNSGSAKSKGGRNARKEISAIEAAARARQSERDKAKAQAGAFHSSVTTIIGSVRGARSAMPRHDPTGHFPRGGVCHDFWKDFADGITEMDDWKTPVIEIKRLEAFVTFETEPFGLVHTCLVSSGFDWDGSSKPIGDLSPRHVKSKSMLKKTPLVWEKGEYKLSDFCPVVLFEDVSEEQILEGKNVIIEIVCQWRVKGM